MGDNKQICRLCLDIVPATEAEVIEEKKKTILEVLLINVDLHVTENAVACSKCMEELQNGFEFKSACLHMDNGIFTFVDADVSVDIKEDFHGEMSGTTMADVKSDKRQICLLCRSLIVDEALDCNTEFKDIIANCLPEVDIHTVHEPLVCGLCFSRMKKLNEFMKTCQEVERRINNYCHAAAGNIIPVSLKDLLKFKDSTINKLIKEECSNFDSIVERDLKEEDTASVECEEIHIKSELESGDEMGDSILSGACNTSSSSKRKRQIRQFTSKGHMAKHPDPRAERIFKCVKCPYETNYKSHLCRHNMLIHMDKSEVEMYKCDHCEYATKRKINLKTHVLNHHDPKAGKKFKCDKCPYETNQKSHLNQHNLIHMDKSEVEMHKCDHCEYATKRHSNLTTHMLKHRDPTAEKKFKCDKCPYETNQKSHLSQHSLIHMDKSEVQLYKCENCEFETRYKSYMKQHTMKHCDPEGKFKCDQCPYETNSKSSLRTHNLKHKDESEVQMYKCVNCDFETRDKGHMVRHMLAS